MAFIDKTIEVAADVRDVYEAWTCFEDYPKFMETIETVTVLPASQLHWVALVEEDCHRMGRGSYRTHARPGRHVACTGRSRDGPSPL